MSEAARLLVSSLAERMPGQVEVITLGDEDTERDLLSWPLVPIAIYGYSLSKSYRLSFSLVRALLKQRADVLHVHAIWSFHIVAACLWKLKTGGAVVITPHGMLEPWIMARKRTVKCLLRRSHLDWLVEQAACIHVLTEKERDNVALIYPRARAEVIPNFAALPRPDHSPGKPGWWQLDMAGKEIYLFLGRLHEKKGCRELLTAWIAACTADVGFRARSQLVFCGWNDGLDAFSEEVAAAADLHGNVLYAGPIYGAEKEQTLAAATFFILPSKSEGLPMTVLEAWAHGAVVIMSKECNLAEGFSRDAAIRCGTTAPEIAMALAVATNASAEDRVRLVSNGRGLVEELFSSEAATSAMIALYERAFQASGASK